MNIVNSTPQHHWRLLSHGPGGQTNPLFSILSSLWHRTVASSKSAGGTRLPRGQEDCSAEGARIEALERRWALGFSGGTAPLGYGPDVAHIIVMFRFTQIRLNKVYTDWMTSFI